MKKRAVIGVLALILILAFGGGAMALAADEALETEDGIIVDGVYTGSINLSGLTAAEAESAVQDYIDELGSKTVTMVTGEHEDTFTLSEIGINWLNEEILDEAMNLGKSGNLIARFKALSDLKNENYVYELELELDEENLQTYVEEVLEAYNQEAVEPSLDRVDGVFIITEEEEGLVVDAETTMAELNSLLDEEWTSDSVTVETTVVVSEPEHTASELECVQDKMGSCTTTYDTSNTGRSQSLELSASRLDGTIIWPGETISVSTLMGERSEEGGYGTGQGYFGTDVEETVGAGICQTASTLYDAALYAELDIVERYHHTLIVHYVDYAMDSTIYAGSDYENPLKDLKIKNCYDYPIYIGAYASGGVCTFNLYGCETRAENREVEYISTTISYSMPTEITYTDDPTLPVGYYETTQSAYPAVTATLTKVVYIDGVETERTLLYTDTYTGSNKKVTRGTKSTTTTTTTAAESETTTSPSESSSETTTQPSTESSAETTTETQAPETTSSEESSNEG